MTKVKMAMTKVISMKGDVTITRVYHGAPKEWMMTSVPADETFMRVVGTIRK